MLYNICIIIDFLCCVLPLRVIWAELSRGKGPKPKCSSSMMCTYSHPQLFYHLHHQLFLSFTCVYRVCVDRRLMAPWTVSAWLSPARSTAGARCWRWAATMAASSSGISSHAALPKLSVHIFTQCALYGEMCYLLAAAAALFSLQPIDQVYSF